MALSRCKAFCLFKALGWGVTAVALTSSPTALAGGGSMGQFPSLSETWGMAEARSWANQRGRLPRKEASPGDAPRRQERWLNEDEHSAKNERDWGSGLTTSRPVMTCPI